MKPKTIDLKRVRHGLKILNEARWRETWQPKVSELAGYINGLVWLLENAPIVGNYQGRDSREQWRGIVAFNHQLDEGDLDDKLTTLIGLERHFTESQLGRPRYGAEYDKKSFHAMRDLLTTIHYGTDKRARHKFAAFSERRWTYWNGSSNDIKHMVSGLFARDAETLMATLPYGVKPETVTISVVTEAETTQAA